jgi:hypothetical protein
LTRLAERWAPWLAAAVLVAGVAAFAITKYGGSSTQAPAPHRPAPLTPAERHVAYAFLDTAVARKQLARAWGLAAPELKQGLTLDEWKTGAIPVVPYPVSQARVTLRTVSSFTDAASLRVTFRPRSGTTAQPATFVLDLHNVSGRWLVSAWEPTSTILPQKGK